MALDDTTKNTQFDAEHRSLLIEHAEREQQAEKRGREAERRDQFEKVTDQRLTHFDKAIVATAKQVATLLTGQERIESKMATAELVTDALKEQKDEREHRSLPRWQKWGIVVMALFAAGTFILVLLATLHGLSVAPVGK